MTIHCVAKPCLRNFEIGPTHLATWFFAEKGAQNLPQIVFDGSSLQPPLST